MDLTMKNDQLPDALYRSVKGSRSAGRATLVCSLQHDGTVPVVVDAERASWTPRAAAILRELRQAGGESGTDRGNSLPFASLRAAIATVVPEAVLLERDLGGPWLENPRPFLDVPPQPDLRDRLGRALSLWSAQVLRPWAEKVEADEILVDTLQEMGRDAFEVGRIDGSLPEVIAAGGSFPQIRDAIVQQFAGALEGKELFDGLGPVWRIVRGNGKSNELEFITWPAVHEDALYSMVACVTVETMPFSKQPIINVRASRRRWLANVPSGGPLTGQRGVTVTLMGRLGPHVALEVSAPVRARKVQDPVAPEFLGQLLRVGPADLGAPLSELVERGAGSETFVGVAYSPKLGGSHPIGAGVSTRDQTDLFDAVQEAVDPLGFVPLDFAETPPIRRAPKRSEELHKALETEALLSDIAISMGRNDLDDDASLEVAWASLGLGEEAPPVTASTAATARERLAEVRSANAARVIRVFGDRKPSVVLIARTDDERRLLQTVLTSLFGSAVEIEARALPAGTHGAKASLPVADGKTAQRFEARVEAWRPLAEIIAKTCDGSHALVQATDWYDKKPDDPVNKPAGRYALASIANANVQYLRPRAPGHRGFANYLHRVQAAVYDLVFGHSGLVSEVASVVAGGFPDVETRPTSIIGISVLTQARNRFSATSGKLCIATRIDCDTGRTTARVGWYDGGMRWSASWEPLFEALKKIASPNIKASLGGPAVERESFQTFVREILDERAEVGDRPFVMIDSTSASSLWPWLTDGKVGGEMALGTERLDASRRWPGVRIVRIRLGHAARIAERKTALYEQAEPIAASTARLLERYCPTVVARTVRLGGAGTGTGHYWSTAGYFQMSFPRGLSVYRTFWSMVPVQKAFKDAPTPVDPKGLLAKLEIPIFDVSYRLPNPIEITVATTVMGDDPDRIAHFVSSLRYGYGHTAASTSLPAPLSFQSKVRDYMTRFALDVSDEEDEAAAEDGIGAIEGEGTSGQEEPANEQDTAFQVTDPRAWRQLLEKDEVSVVTAAPVAEPEAPIEREAAAVVVSDTTGEDDADGGGASSDSTPEGDDRTWSELQPVIRLPAFVTVDWLAANATVANSQLRAIHEERDLLMRLSGFGGWPLQRPSQAEFAALLHAGLRYPRFAVAFTQIAKRSVALAKRQYWSIFKNILSSAYGLSAGISQASGRHTPPKTDMDIAETLANGGQLDLALAHLFRRAYIKPLPAEVRRMIAADDHYSPLREFIADVSKHLHRSDYDWETDLQTFPTNPAEGTIVISDAGEAAKTLAIGEADDDGKQGGDPATLQEKDHDLHISPQAEPNATPLATVDTERTPMSDGLEQWADEMAAIVAAARSASSPDADVLDQLSSHVGRAAEALSAFVASRPRGIDSARLLDRALEVFTAALTVMVEAQEPEESIPVAPTGPFAELVEPELAAELEASLSIAEELASEAGSAIADAKEILGKMQMARLPEAMSLKAKAVTHSRDAAERAIEALDRIKAGSGIEPGETTAAPAISLDLKVVAPPNATEEIVDDDASDDGVADAGLWDSAQDADVPDEPIEMEVGSEQLADAIMGDGLTDASDEQVDPVTATPGPDPLQPMLLERFENFVAGGRFGLAFHMSRAASEAALFDAFPLSRAELRLAAISGHVSHAALQGSPFVHELLKGVHSTFSEMEDEAPHAVARRILALGSLAEFALFHNDPAGKDALEELRNVADGLGDAVHVFREALGAPLKHGLNLSPALMRAAGEEAKDDENSRRLIARVLSDIEDFSNKTYKFQLGNKLRNVLTKSDGELGRLRDRVAKGGNPALEATREFATSYRDRGQIIDLLAVAEIRANNFKMTGIDGIARDRMVGLIQGIAATCAEYVEISDAAPAIKRTLANIQRDRTEIVDATTALDAALERYEPNGALEEGAVRSARRALAGFLGLVRGLGRTPQPTDHLAAVHAPLLWVPTLDFGLGWLPSPYVPETVLELLVHSDPAGLSEPVGPEAFAEQVRDRISTGSHIPAAMMLSLGGYYAIPAEDVQGLQEFRLDDMGTRRDALNSQLLEARLLVDRAQRTSGAGSQDEAQSLLSLLDRISPDELPSEVPLESRGEDVELEQILDFKAAYGLIDDVRTKVETLLKRPRDALVARIEAMAKAGTAAAGDLAKVRSLVVGDDLLTANEYLEFLQDGRALPETTSPNPRFRAFYPAVPEQLTATPRPSLDQLATAIGQGSGFAGLDFGRLQSDRRVEALEGLELWSELRRSVASGRQEADVALRLERMFEQFGLRVDVRSSQQRNSRKLYVVDMRIDLFKDEASVLLPDFGSLTDGNYRVCIGMRLPNDGELRSLQAEAGVQRLIYIVTDTVLPERRRQLHLSCLENRSKLLVVDEAMVVFALAEPEGRGLTLIELAQPFAYADPYKDYGNGAVPREMFFGRVKERLTLLDPFGSCIVYGGRRLGKTALLKQVADEAEDTISGSAAVYVSIRELSGSAGNLWFSISKEFTTVFNRPVDTSDKFSDGVRVWLDADFKRRILVLLDETDNFIKSDSTKNFVHFIQLQKLMDDTGRRFKFVLAGLHNVTRLVHTENSPLKQIASDAQRIGPLMDAELGDAELLVTRPMAGMGYEFQNREDVWRILSYCNYYPVLVQKFCKGLLETLVADVKKRRSPVVITAAHIKEALDDEDIGIEKEIGETFDMTIKIEQRYALIANIVADRALRDAMNGRIGEGMSAVEVLDAAESWWPEAFSEANRLAVVEDLLDEMEGLGVLREVSGSRWALRSPTILRLLGDDDKIATTLGDFLDKAAPSEFDPGSTRRKLRQNDLMRIPEGVTCPLTLSQETDLLRDRAPVTLIFGSRSSSIEMVTGALASLGEAIDGRSSVEVHARSFMTADAMVKELKSGKDQVTLYVVPELSPWDASWVDQALRLKPVREGRVRVIFVGRPEHALSWIQDPRRASMAGEVKVVPLQTWSTTLADDMLEREHLDTDMFRGQVLEATGGYNSLVQQVFSGASSTGAKSFGARLQTMASRRRREQSLPVELGLVGDMLAVFRGIVEFTKGDDITAYYIKDGVIEGLGLDLSGQTVVDYGLLMALLEERPFDRSDAADGRPFRVNPLLNTLFGTKVAQ